MGEMIIEFTAPASITLNSGTMSSSLSSPLLSAAFAFVSGISALCRLPGSSSHARADDGRLDPRIVASSCRDMFQQEFRKYREKDAGGSRDLHETHTGIVKRRREEPGHTGHRWEPDTRDGITGTVSKLARYFKTPSSVLPKAGKGVGEG